MRYITMTRKKPSKKSQRRSGNNINPERKNIEKSIRYRVPEKVRDQELMIGLSGLGSLSAETKSSIKKFIEQEEKIQKRLDSLGRTFSDEIRKLNEVQDLIQGGMFPSVEIRKHQDAYSFIKSGGLAKGVKKLGLTLSGLGSVLSENKKVVDIISDSTLGVSGILGKAGKEIERVFSEIYRFPTLNELEGIRNSNFFATKIFSDNPILLKELEVELQKISTPWVKIGDVAKSIDGTGELIALRGLLRSEDPYSFVVNTAIRHDLGDWREAKASDESVVIDPVCRTVLYLDYGYEAELTNAPLDAILPILKGFGLLSNNFLGDEDDRLGHISAILLRSFERLLRQFISVQLNKAYGQNWIRQKINGEIWQEWERKRNEAAAKNEKVIDLIEYADFSDYVRIITRKDLWSEVFKPVFHVQVAIEETFRRLNIVRISCMHSRMVTLEDCTYLTVEVYRMLKAMGYKIKN